MKSSISTVCGPVNLEIISLFNPSRMLFKEGIFITFFGLISFGLFNLPNGHCAINYFTVLAVSIEIRLQQIISERLQVKGACWASFRKSKKQVNALCEFFGNALLGSLGAEIAGLRAIFLPAVGFLQFFFKELIQKAGLAHCTTK